jgi:predicted amidohydrolase
MNYHGFLRVAAATPTLRVADCASNAARILSLMERSQAEGVALVVFPELSLTGYTCADLFQQAALQKGALAALEQITDASRTQFSGLAVLGLPLAVDDQLFNCAALIQNGQILGLVPKSFIPNYKEFYEGRWFAAAATARSRQVVLNGVTVPFGTAQLFQAQDVDGLVIGVEICEDLWVPIPPSSFQALQGATVLVNLSASNEVIGKSGYRRQLVVNQSGRCIAAYVYAACGVWESTTDVVFGGGIGQALGAPRQAAGGNRRFGRTRFHPRPVSDVPNAGHTRRAARTHPGIHHAGVRHDESNTPERPCLDAATGRDRRRGGHSPTLFGRDARPAPSPVRHRPGRSDRGRP